jgi:outer membrane protein insertion porin family
MKRFILTYILLCAAFELIAANPTINRITLNNHSEIADTEIVHVFPFKEGDPFSQADIVYLKKTLTSWGVFDTVTVNTKKSKIGVDINVDVTSSYLIGEIDIVGNYPFIDRRIRKFLTIRPGERYDSKKALDQKARILKFYKREGFIQTKIELKTEKHPFDRNISLTYDIQRGHPLRVNKVIVEGNKAFPKGRFVSAVNPLRRYQERRIKEAARELTDFYHWHGYPRASVKLGTIDINENTRRVAITFIVKEGLHVIVDFVGNKHFTSGELIKVATIYKDGGYDSYEREASIDSIKKHYFKAGYPEATISSSQATNEEGTIVVTFKIDEGIHQRVRHLDFEDNDSISSRKLRKALKTKQVSLSDTGIYNPAVLPYEEKALAARYAQDGFIDVKVGTPKIEKLYGDTQINITFPITEGVEFTVDDITFAGVHAFTDKALLKELINKIGKPVNANELKKDRERLVTYYGDHGYPYASVTQIVKRSANTISIAYTVREGRYAYIKDVITVGNFLTAYDSILQTMRIRPGDPYSAANINKSELQLRRLGVFRTARIKTIGIDERRDDIFLIVELEEEKPFLVDVDFSYSTDDAYGGSLRFTNFNSFGWAKQTHLYLTGGRELSRVELGWLDPHIFGSELQFFTNTWLEFKDRPSFSYIQAAGALGILRQFHRTSFLTSYELNRNYFLSGNSADAAEESLRNNTINKTTLSISYDTRNSFADPTAGGLASGGVDFFDEIKGNNAHFTRFRAGGNYQYTLFRLITFVQDLRFDKLQKLTDGTIIPQNERLYLGGDTTIRGFSQDAIGPTNAAGDPVGATIRWIYNAEIRFKIFGNFRMALFYDMGSLTNSFADITPYNIRNSAGVGLRYITPVGPLRLDYGFKIDKRAGEAAGRLHFTFGYVF